MSAEDGVIEPDFPNRYEEQPGHALAQFPSSSKGAVGVSSDPASTGSSFFVNVEARKSAGGSGS